MIFTALASTENARDHGDVAIQMEYDALRYKYMAGIMTSIAGGYHNLGDYLHGNAQQADLAFASHLAAGLIRVLTGTEGTDDSVSAAAVDVREADGGTTPSADVADLCRQLGDIPGTDLPGLLQTLSPDPATAEQTLRDLIALVQALAAAPPETAIPPEETVGDQESVASVREADFGFCGAARCLDEAARRTNPRCRRRVTSGSSGPHPAVRIGCVRLPPDLATERGPHPGIAGDLSSSGRPITGPDGCPCQGSKRFGEPLTAVSSPERSDHATGLMIADAVRYMSVHSRKQPDSHGHSGISPG